MEVARAGQARAGGGRVRGGHTRGCGLAAALAEAVRGGLAAARLGLRTLLLALYLAVHLCTRHLMLLRGVVCGHGELVCATTHGAYGHVPALQRVRRYELRFAGDDLEMILPASKHAAR